MAFFENLGKKISDVAESTADKAKDLAETAKLNLLVSAEEKKINQYFNEIGQLIFEQDKDNPDSPASGLIKKIVESEKIILDVKQKIALIKEDSNNGE